MTMRLATGACGSGKTFRLKMMVAAACAIGFRPFVVLDVKREWPIGVDDPRAGGPLQDTIVKVARPTTEAGLARIAQRIRTAPAFGKKALPPVLSVAPVSTDPESVRWEMDEIARACLDRGGIQIVAPEVWRYMPQRGRSTEAIVEVLHEWRHFNAGLWCDAQGFPEVDKELVRAMHYLIIHATGDRSDREALRLRGGRELHSAVDIVTKLRRRHGPGFHVVMDTQDAAPPYRVLSPRGDVLATIADSADAQNAIKQAEKALLRRAA